MTKIGRNDECWCGSGKKWKHCHYPKRGQESPPTSANSIFGGVVVDMPNFQRAVAIEGRIQCERQEGIRPRPSSSAILIGETVDHRTRRFLLDACARIVDEVGELGRCNMCLYFSALMRHGLARLGHKSEVHIGSASYTSEQSAHPPFTWEHSWVTHDGMVVDGNIDSLRDNVLAPEGLVPRAYWGPANQLPSDRRLVPSRMMSVEDEPDDLYDWEINAYKAQLDTAMEQWKLENN